MDDPLVLPPNILPVAVVGVPPKMDPVLDLNVDEDCCPNAGVAEDEVEVVPKPDSNVFVAD